MLHVQDFRFIIFCVLFHCVKDVAAETIWKALLAPANPPLLKVRNLSEVKGDTKYAVLDFIGLVERYSYPAEEHNVTTDDGYHLRIHRIPSSPHANTTKKKNVVFLQHGLLGSSDSWVLIGPGKDLAYLLADAGYDVWIGNYRGNTYCRSHERLSTTNKEFWDFSFHEHGLYDIRAAIDYVLKYTGNEKLTYIGHSMGTTSSYVFLSMKPEYNKKMKIVVSLSPVAFWNQGLTPFFQRITKNIDKIQKFLINNEIYELGAQSTTNMILGNSLCTNLSPLQGMCTALVNLIGGPDQEQLNTTLLPYFLSYYPAGSSVKALEHYSQNMITGKFQCFDHGPVENYRRFKKKEPPLYDLKRITAPVALIYAKNDGIVKPENAREMSKHLSNIVTMEEVPFELFNHLDFIIARDAKTLLYDRVMELIEDFQDV